MSDALQFFGGLFEIGGLATVGLGIVETRRAFTDRPGIVQHVARAVAEFVARLTRRKHVHTLDVHDSIHMHSAESARVRVNYAFEGTLDERVERLQEIAQQHANRLAEVTELVGSRSEKLQAEIRLLQDALSTRGEQAKNPSSWIVSDISPDGKLVALTPTHGILCRMIAAGSKTLTSSCAIAPPGEQRRSS